MTKRRIAAAAAVLLVLLAVFAMMRAGTSLIVNDAPQKADAIVVIGGRLPFRAMEAGTIYKRGLAPEVWLTMGNRNAAEIELERLDVHATPEGSIASRCSSVSAYRAW
jgi:uncharacterized SAM-binding protein YcdF (DUF218 family)